MSDAAGQQRAVCRDNSTDMPPPPLGSIVGIALQTLDLSPLNGLRIPGHGSACGWYIWGGEATSEDPDFSQPVYLAVPMAATGGVFALVARGLSE